MFGWRKKTEGFDWHTYVRTTIKLRREARKERIDAARQAALEKAHAAGAFVAAGGRAAGAAAVEGAKAGVVQSAQGLSWFARLTAATLGRWTEPGRAKAGAFAAELPASPYAGLAGLLGAVALGSGAAKAWITGLAFESLVPIGIGTVLLLLALPAALARLGMGFPGVSARTVLAAMAAGCVALGGAVAWQLWPADRTTNVIGALSNISLRPVTAKPVEGRAAALSGDTLRVNNQVFVLSGIEAPDRQQACLQNGKRRWRCGERAQLALEAALRAGPVVCTPSTSTDANGRTPASCTMAGKDLADGLVRAGHVFAIPATFGGYGAAEAEARTKKAGLWSGEAERPSVYRARLWDAAKKTSPEGCPIKGTIQGGMKVFVQPWDSGYRRAQVRANRGERWFCNATDAVAAGFKPAERAG